MDEPHKEEEEEIQESEPTQHTEKEQENFIENKRDLLGKKLSTSQRDQMYLNLAKCELKMKQDMVNTLAEATRESNKTFSQIG